MKPLGHIQEGVLRSLTQLGEWSDTGRCGWTWSTLSETKRIMESLVARGLAKKRFAAQGSFGRVSHAYYKISPKGLKVVKELETKSGRETC